MTEITWLLVKKTRRFCYLQYPREKGYIIPWNEGHTKGLDRADESTHYVTMKVDVK